MFFYSVKHFDEKKEVSKQQLKKYHDDLKEEANKCMMEFPRIIDKDHEDECLTVLKKKIEDAYTVFQNQTKEAKNWNVACDFAPPLFSGIVGISAIILHCPPVSVVTAFGLCAWAVIKVILYPKTDKKNN